MTCNARKDIDPRALMDVEVQIAASHAHSVRRRQREWCLAQLEWINAKEEVVHNRITDKDRINDQLFVDLRL